MTILTLLDESLSSEILQVYSGEISYIANKRYNHLAAPWDAPLAFGKQAFIEYNGLILNDRYQSDFYRITNITGLDDASVRDAREVKASSHGEFPYDAFYGGRNLVMTGNIESASLQVAKKLESNLKGAFAPLVESPLKFRWFDIVDNFDDPQTIFPYNEIETNVSGNYISVVGSLSNLNVENSFLSWKNIGRNYIVRCSEKRVFCDTQTSLRVIPGSLNNNSFIGFIHSFKDPENYILFLYYQTSGTPFLNIESVIEGKLQTPVTRVAIPSGNRPIIGQSVWIRGRKESNYVTMEYWTSFPEENKLPTFSVNGYLKSEESELFGDEIMAQVGIAGEQKDTLWKFDEFKIESIYPGDVNFNARKLSELSIKEEQTSLNKFKMPLQITMKTSDFRSFASTQSYKSIIPTEVSTPLLGRSYPRSYPRSYRHYISSSLPKQSNILNINNRGNVFTEAILVFKGAGENLYIENLTNEQKLVWNGKVEDKENIIFDCYRETVINESGSNKIESLLPTLQWIKLDPGWNDIYINGINFSSNTIFTAFWNHGYL